MVVFSQMTALSAFLSLEDKQTVKCPTEFLVLQQVEPCGYIQNKKPDGW